MTEVPPPPTPTKSTPPVTVVGIDIGSETTKVVLGSHKYSCEIVRSNAGLHATPTAVSFLGKQRQIGETAQLKGSNAVLCLNRLLLMSSSSTGSSSTSSDSTTSNDFLSDFYQFDASTNTDTDNANAVTTSVTVDYNGDRKTFTSAALLAMLLGNLQASVVSTIHRVSSGTADAAATTEDIIHYVLSVSPGFASLSQSQLLDAAHAAGMTHVQLVERPVAYAAAYLRKFPLVHNTIDKSDADANANNNNNTNTKNCLVIDMGHAQTSTSVIQFGGGGTMTSASAAAATTAEGLELEVNPADDFTVLASRSDTNLGAASVDVRLWHHFQTTLPTLQNVDPKSRAGQRLLTGCHKLKHLLSQLPEGNVMVENVGANDTDIQLKATRQVLADLCQPEQATLTALMKSVIAEATAKAAILGTDTDCFTIDTVEVLGGGCRIPWVQTAIQEALLVASSGRTVPLVLAKSLDDTSAALGAALVGEMNDPTLLVPTTTVERDDDTQDRRAKLLAQEKTMAALDQDESIKAELRNQIETKVLQLRSAKHDSKHANLLPTEDNLLDSYLDELDDWIFSEACETASRQEMEEHVARVHLKISAMCGDYYAAVQADALTKEAELEADAKQAQLEAAGADAANNGEEDDHDNRRLPKKRRMEIVLKNKEEANELFKDGNWRFAAARYTKALTHCAKFVDLAPDDITEVTTLKVTLNLNLALAYMKLDNADQALRVCNEAVSLDDAAPKAYYRRASVFYEKKRWDDAKKDVTKALSLLGEGVTDKAIQKLGDKIDAQLKRQKQKEKKMAGKMFG